MGHGEINYLMLADQFDYVLIIGLNSLFVFSSGRTAQKNMIIRSSSMFQMVSAVQR
jgi:hypothetical protein